MYIYREREKRLLVIGACVWYNSAQSDGAFTCSTRRTVSLHLRNTPSVPVIPIPSIISRVSRNGTCSGVARYLPCSKQIPKSMCTISADFSSMSMLKGCLSPTPRM